MKKYFFSKFSPTSYVKLQDAYAVEKNAVGSWTLIGYKAPQTTGTANETTNFAYTEDYTGGKSEVWTAKSKVKLNDCAIGNTWTVTSAMADAAVSADVNHTAAIGDSTNCEGLTPSFTSLSVTAATQSGNKG